MTDDIRDINQKLDNMSEQISKLRESAARTEAFLHTITPLQRQVNSLSTQQNQFKGGIVVLSAIFSAIAAVAARLLIK